MSQKIVKRIKKHSKGDRKLYKGLKVYYDGLNISGKAKFNKELKELK